MSIFSQLTNEILCMYVPLPPPPLLTYTLSLVFAKKIRYNNILYYNCPSLILHRIAKVCKYWRVITLDYFPWTNALSFSCHTRYLHSLHLLSPLSSLSSLSPLSSTLIVFFSQSLPYFCLYNFTSGMRAMSDVLSLRYAS